MMLRIRIDKKLNTAYVDSSMTQKGAFDMWSIRTPDGTTFFPRTGVEAVKIFEHLFGTGVVIRCEAEKKEMIKKVA